MDSDTSRRLQKSSLLGFLVCSESQKLLWILLFCIGFVLNNSTVALIVPSPEVEYTLYCNNIVPESTSTVMDASAGNFLKLQNGYFTGGDKIFGQNPEFGINNPKSLSFRTGHLYKTDAEGVFKVYGSLDFQGSSLHPVISNATHKHGHLRYRPPRIPVRRGGIRFGLHGFWSSSSGKLCLVGSGSSYSIDGSFRNYNVVLKLNYPNNSNIFTSLVSGVLESLDTQSSLNYFEPISMVGISVRNYELTLDECLNGIEGKKNTSLGLEGGRGACPLLISSADRFELEYGSHCVSVDCNPLGMNIGYMPKFMFLTGIHCFGKQSAQFLLRVSKEPHYGRYDEPLVPNTTLVAEGSWDGKNNQFCATACRVLNFSHSLSDAFIGDCSIKLRLRFSSTLSIKSRSNTIGQIWSNKTTNDSGYFGELLFHSLADKMIRVPGLKYEYTKIESVKGYCLEKNTVKKHKGKKYPNSRSSDLRFYMTIRNRNGVVGSGYSSPLFVGDLFYEPVWSTNKENNIDYTLVNISYMISFTSSIDFNLGGKTFMNTSLVISAEGIYDAEHGRLCMVGCRDLGSKHNQNLTKNDSFDCEIRVTIQFPPLDAKGGALVQGTIDSTRERKDLLYFDPLELSSNSIYTSQAKESVWRMDLEVTMVLITNTLACIFVGLQLFYVKKKPKELPFISIAMLTVITLGHMSPLVLNFEALFVSNRNRQNVFLGSGSWLEVNEVIIRVITMFAFLLEFRLLQLTWSSRSYEETHKGIWVSEKKVLFLCLPLYLGGGLIAFFLHQWKISQYNRPFRRARMWYKRLSLWGDLKSYAGLILDGFLLPQIIFNLFFNSREKALSPSFYVGTTVVRLLPHVYNLYMAYSSSWNFDLSYLYANPRMDFFSKSWDLMIPFFGLLFVALIYLQQRFGGRCILPKRFRHSSAYVKVPVVSNE